MQPIHGDERFFEGYLTVQIKDKQGEITVVDELYKVLPIWMDRGAPISDTHSNRIIGKGINYSKDTYKDKDGEEYPAIKITGKIHKDYELDNEIWKKIKSGEYKGLSFGGATKSDRDPVRMKDGSIAYSLKDLEHYEVAVCADPAVPLALITDYNPVAKSATNAEVREDGKMIIKCDKFGCYVSKVSIDQKDDDVSQNKKIGRAVASWSSVPADNTERYLKEVGNKTRRIKPCENCGAKDQIVEGQGKDGKWHSYAETDVVDGKRIDICPTCNRAKVERELSQMDPKRYGGKSPKDDVGKADNITKPIPDGKGGKGDFDHCEEKNQDKNDPAAFCGAIQHKLEKAIEAGMIQQVAKDGLEIFLTKEELNKVCSGCGKTLAEHGIVKYDHSNSMGDQHSMYNQNTGRETWVGQGLPQPTVEGKDDHPAERGLTINGDARQNSGKKKVKKTLTSIFKEDDKWEPKTDEYQYKKMGKKPPKKKKPLMPASTTRAELDADEDYQDWMAEGESEHYYNDMENEFQSLSQGDDPDKDKKIDALGSAGTPANVVAQQRKQQRKVEEDLKRSPDFFEDEKQTNKGRTARNRKRRKQEIVDAEIGSMVNQSFVSIVKGECSGVGCKEEGTIPMRVRLDTGDEGDIKVCENCNRKIIEFAEGKGDREGMVGKSFESLFKDAVKPTQAQLHGESNKPTDYEYENMPEGVKFMGRDFSEFQTPKPLDNEFQRQSTEARMGEGSSNEDNYLDMDELGSAANLGLLPQTFDDKRSGQIKERHEVKHPQLDKSFKSIFKKMGKKKKKPVKSWEDLLLETSDVYEEEPCPHCGKTKSLESIVSKDSMDGKGSDKPKPEPTPEQKIMDLDISHEGTGYDPERMSYSKRPTDRAWEEWDERQRGMFDQGDYQSFESKNREHWADRGVKSDDIPDYGDWLYEKFPEKEGLKPPRKDAMRKSLESIISKVTEGQFGAGQRGLGYGNEGYTNVQGSGQNHTITEIPPEMEIIVHDVNDIKESKKEGYTTEAGNSKRGDPSRAIDDDDSLLSPKYI